MRLRNIIILLAVLLALGGVYYYINLPEPAPETPPKTHMWSIDEESLTRIEIALPREKMTQAFIKSPDGSWLIDGVADPQKAKVDTNRWGGITSLLSGPAAERIVARNATGAQMDAFGLAQPRMSILLILTGGKSTDIAIGDSVPDGHAYYVRIPGTDDVAVVDKSWYSVMERLVKEPPYGAK